MAAPSAKIFIGGLAWASTNESLRTAFEAYGEVVESRVVTDRETGRSRGFGFVTFADAASVAKSIDGMNGQDLDGRAVRVTEANDRPAGDRPPRSGGDSYGGRRDDRSGGGYGGGRGGGGYGGDRRDDRGGGGYGGGRDSGRDSGYGGGSRGGDRGSSGGYGGGRPRDTPYSRPSGDRERY
ncbi:hypothetical protein SmJEL517_g00803 [Synchytrium microbalum]|uniref:RRM domain-containing protein n=1 Tax=Synchytrium microbalum TaxID=1806994 RepID=A0A507C600_9FUNG|nr:uncharacterized protein SmJEL517_g00803 [Synchytrium microbalum]TPX37020.1 hypothetical protein SmJEL517_g00803 [Synchytrium microbalum]